MTDAVEIVVRAGRRAARRTATSADAYGEALTWIEQALGFPHHEIMFETYRPGMLVFSVTPAWRPTVPLTPFALTPLGELKPWLLGFARALGFPLAGVAAPQLPARYTERFTQWLARAGHGGMGYLERQRDKRLDPRLVLAGARSVLALATPYPRERHGPIARYAQGRDYHEVLSARLDVLRRVLYREVPGVRVFLSVDTGPVLERAYAEQAGIGWIGKNGVLMSRAHGSYLSLATLWTTLDLAPDAPHAEHCGTCSDCLGACPTQAITAPGWVESAKCISYWTIEHPGEIPAEAPAAHGWLFGCDVCQEVCPWNRFAGPVALAALAPRAEPFGGAQAWLDASDAAVEARIAQTALRRAGVAGLRRNARRLLPIVT